MKIYLVGGAVRDRILGKQSNDHDFVVVGATPDQVKALGYESVGESFPVFLAPNGDQYALARTERKVGLGYQGFEVEYDPSVTLEDDLFRRDLTINAIARDVKTGELVDPYGGISDLQNKVLKHVSDAFQEDPLRVIRLARFSAKFYDFTIAPNTIILCKNIVCSGELNEISDERFLLELTKTFDGSCWYPERFFETLFRVQAHHCNFFKDLFGSLDPFHDGPHIKKRCDAVMKLDVEKRVPFFIASIAKSKAEQNSTAIPSKIKQLTKQCIKLWQLIPNMVNEITVMDILTSTRAFNENDKHIDELIELMECCESSGGFFHLPSSGLKECVKESRTVLVSDFLGKFNGAELGSILYRERTLKIKDVLESQRENS